MRLAHTTWVEKSTMIVNYFTENDIRSFSEFGFDNDFISYSELKQLSFRRPLKSGIRAICLILKLATTLNVAPGRIRLWRVKKRLGANNFRLYSRIPIGKELQSLILPKEIFYVELINMDDAVPKDNFWDNYFMDERSLFSTLKSIYDKYEVLFILMSYIEIYLRLFIRASEIMTDLRIAASEKSFPNAVDSLMI